MKKGAYEVYFHAWPVNEKSYYSIIFKEHFDNFSKYVYMYILCRGTEKCDLGLPCNCELQTIKLKMYSSWFQVPSCFFS